MLTMFTKASNRKDGVMLSGHHSIFTGTSSGQVFHLSHVPRQSRGGTPNIYHACKYSYPKRTK